MNSFLALCVVTAQSTQLVDEILPSVSVKQPALRDAVQEVLTSFVEHGATPEARGIIAGILPRLQEIKQDIKRAHAETSGEMDGKISELRKTTEEVVAAKAKADKSDTNWVRCVADEKVELERYDKAVTLAHKAAAEKKRLCQLVPHDEIQQSGRISTFACSLESGKTCLAQWEKFKAAQLGKQKKLSETVKSLVKGWETANSDCSAAKQAAEEALKAEKTAQQEWISQQVQCVAAKGSAKLKRCEWASRMDSKCLAKAEYKALRQNVVATGNVHSEADRVQEWTAASIAMCMMRKLDADSTISGETSRDCNASIDFTSDVGSLELEAKDRQYKALTEGANFNCQEEAFKFNGTSWRVPEYPIYSAEDYVFEPVYSVPGPYTKVLELCGEVPGGDAPIKQKVFPLQLTSGLSAYGHPFLGPEQVLLSSGLCVVNGMIKGNEWDHVADLRPDCHPTQRLVFSMSFSDRQARVAITASGRVEWLAGPKNGAWMSITGVIFAPGTADHKVVPLVNGWRRYGGDHTGADYILREGVCLIEGLVAQGKSGDIFKLPAEIGKLPAECRPMKLLVFSVGLTLGVRVFASGKVELFNGDSGHSWVSLTGIRFAPGGPNRETLPLELANIWSVYGPIYGNPEAVVSGGLCLVQGMLSGNKPWSFPPATDVARLPLKCRPSKQMTFALMGNGGNRVVDVLDNGWIVVRKTGNRGWLSLSGIAIPVASTS